MGVFCETRNREMNQFVMMPRTSVLVERGYTWLILNTFHVGSGRFMKGARVM